MSAPLQRRETPGETLYRNRFDRQKLNGHARQLEWLHPHMVAARLSPKAWRKHGTNGALAQCPCHEDATPSLSIDLKDDKLLLKCFAGCPQSELMAAFIDRGLAVFQPSNARRPKIDISGNLLALQGRGFKLAPYDYIDADGVLIYQNVRAELFDKSGKRLAKTFRQRRPTPDGKGWIENLHGLEKLPAYRLPALLTSQEQDIHICEGEKDADALAAHGLLATNINILERTDLGALGGRNLVLHEDNDSAGRRKVADSLAALESIAGSMRVVSYRDAGHGGDVSDWLAKHTLEELLERIEAAKDARATDSEQKTGTASALEFDDQIAIDTSVNALVKGILHPGDIAALYGSSGAGKTFTLIDLAYHIAGGVSWHGRRVRPAPVLYVGLEGARGLRHRMAAYARHMGFAGCMLARLTVHAPLDKSEVGKAGEALIIEQAKVLGAVAGKPVGLIIIDTLARAIAGDDENSAQDMAAFVGRMSRIARETGAAVVIAHHPGKDDARGMRGSTALFAACDTVIKITGKGNVREVTTEKVKDGVMGPLFSYTLEQVSLGVDEDGDEITSCIVRATAGSSMPRRAKLSVQHRRAHDQLLRIYTDDAALCIDPKLIGLGDIDPRRNPRVATLEEWRTRCRAAGLTATGNASSERSAFNRAVEEIEKAGLVGRYGDYVWLLSQTNRTPDPAGQNGEGDEQ